MRSRKRWGAALCSSLLLAAGLTVGGTSAGRRSVGRLLGGQCPFAPAAGASAEDLQRVYGQQIRLARGLLPSRGQYALGLQLKQTSRAEFNQWAQAHGARCQGRGDSWGLQCQLDDFAQVRGSFYPHGSGSLAVRFDPRGKLQAIAVQQHLPSSAVAVEAVSLALTHLGGLAGPPERLRGTLAADYLGQGALRQVGGDFRFTDYLAEVSATHMGKMGYIHFAQSYTSLQDP